jgi:hypothetical protein
MEPPGWRLEVLKEITEALVKGCLTEFSTGRSRPQQATPIFVSGPEDVPLIITA